MLLERINFLFYFYFVLINSRVDDHSINCEQSTDGGVHLQRNAKWTRLVHPWWNWQYHSPSYLLWRSGCWNLRLLNFHPGVFKRLLISWCSIYSIASNDISINICQHLFQTNSLGVGAHWAKYDAWRVGDTKLDWFGAQPGQGTYNDATAYGTPLAWTTSNQAISGYHPLNKYAHACIQFMTLTHSNWHLYGSHYWWIDRIWLW